MIKLKRTKETANSTLGILTIDDFFCYTLEDGKREKKEFGKTRIPEGIYEIKLRKEGTLYKKYSERFHKPHPMLWLQNVPNFEYVYLHIGNLVSETNGCVLVGDSYVLKEDYELKDSLKVYIPLHDLIVFLLKKEKVFIEIS